MNHFDGNLLSFDRIGGILYFVKINFILAPYLGGNEKEKSVLRQSVNIFYSDFMAKSISFPVEWEQTFCSFIRFLLQPFVSLKTFLWPISFDELSDCFHSSNFPILNCEVVVEKSFIFLGNQINPIIVLRPFE